MVRSGAGVIANISVQLNKPEKAATKFYLSRVLLKCVELDERAVNDDSSL